MHQRVRRSAIAFGSAGLLCVVVVLGGAAASGLAAKGIKGDPQPEMKPFRIGAAAGGGTVAIESNGSLVTAYSVGTSNAEGAAEICVLARGGHTCTHRVELKTASGDDAFGIPQVFVDGSKIVVLQNTCCDANVDGDDLMFTSTDGGAIFVGPTRVGSVGISAAVRIGHDVVITGGDPHSGTQVASIADDTAGPQLSFAQVTDQPPVDVALSDYKDGVLAGNDVLGKDYTTSVEYAPSGMDFNSAASYTKVASFSHESLVAMSGNALLTSQTTGKEHLLLRFFNGSSFGSPHAVPGYKGTQLGTWTTLDKDPSGVTHIFLESSFVAPIYDMLETSTTSGAHWSSRTDLGNAISNNVFNVDLDSIGSGLVIGGGSGPEHGYPVLAHQGVTFALSKSSLKVGHHTTGKGTASAAAAGRKITLQIEHHGEWFTVTSTHEKASGAFSFTITAKSVGSATYRAVANDHAGYVQFGYSAARTLHGHK
jgi:hypothetical protein